MIKYSTFPDYLR